MILSKIKHPTLTELNELWYYKKSYISYWQLLETKHFALTERVVIVIKHTHWHNWIICDTIRDKTFHIDKTQWDVILFMIKHHVLTKLKYLCYYQRPAILPWQNWMIYDIIRDRTSLTKLNDTCQRLLSLEKLKEKITTVTSGSVQSVAHAVMCLQNLWSML